MGIPEHREIQQLARRFLGKVAPAEVARLYRDARILTLYEGTSEVQTLGIGAHLTGIKALGEG